MLGQKECAPHLINPVTSLHHTLPTIMDWMFISPWNSYVEIVTPDVMVLRGEALPIVNLLLFILLNDYCELLIWKFVPFFNFVKLSIIIFPKTDSLKLN